ncbi:MAG: DUF1054 domain-containing protein [Bacillaceae bacterium]|nr:DUF1054 domain-containing protein [Bacillaceae bacterium]
MVFEGFTKKDFDVFKVEGLEPRMDALKAEVRPKLETLGQQLAPYLSGLVGDEMFYHVAKHARRTVNPPDDTWVAWAADKRGYKKHPHFQVGMWSTHLFAWFAVIYECENKPVLGKNLEKELDTIRNAIPGDFVWSTDHTQPDVTRHRDMTDDDWARVIHRLQNVKKAELLCGIHINRDDQILENGEKLVEKIEQTFETVMPLYRLSF